MPKTILFVDNDDSLLEGLPSSRHYSFVHVSSYGKAFSVLKAEADCRVVMAGLALGEEDGITFLNLVRKKYPKIVRMALVSDDGCARMQEALNKGRVFQFVNKPCSPVEVERYIAKALTRYDKDKKQRQAARMTLLGSVKAMVDILDLVSPEAMGFAKRIRERVLKIGKMLGVPSLWRLELAVLLSHVGCVALPSDIMEKMDHGGSLSPEEQQIFGMHPSIAANLLANINQMDPVAAIIEQQHNKLSDDQLLEARIIKVALELDFQERKGKDPIAVLKKMASRKKTFDVRVVKAMLKMLHQSGVHSVRQVNVEELQEGMVLAEDLVNMEGVKLLLRGQAVSKASLIRLQSFHIALGVVDPIHVVSDEQE